MTSNLPLCFAFLLLAVNNAVIKCSPTVDTSTASTAHDIDENYTLAPNAPEIEVKALKFIKDVNKKTFAAANNLAVVSWNYETNITKETTAAQTKALTDNFKNEADIQHQVQENFPNWENFSNPDLVKMFSNFAIQGPGNMSLDHIEKMTEIQGKMETAYSTTTICDYKDKTKCGMRLRDIDSKLDTSKDWDELVYYWSEWHNAMGKEVPPSLYQTFMEYQNEMARANDFKDMSEMWLTQYNDYSDDWTPDNFKKEIRELESEIRPYYNKLHAYVRMKLRQKPEYADKISKTGYLPAHILGNMWGQDWAALDSATKPFPNIEVSSAHATKAMKKAGYTVEKMFREADNFFSDLGLLRVPQTFWKYSRFERPKDGREVVCHPSAWDFSNGTDVRITMCSEVTLDDMLTAQHELGHIQYYLQYKEQPNVFQDGANPGFHEAIGDSMALSIMTPRHLQCQLKLDLGFKNICDKTDSSQTANHTITDMEMNFLYITALQKIPFLPFSYALEAWRWEAFNLTINANDYNEKWWNIH